MSPPDGDRDRDEPVTVTDKRRIDPQTGEIRDAGGQERSDSGHVSGPALVAGVGGLPGESPRSRIRRPNRSGDLQRVQADFANYQ